jgi:hypothetical protein
MKISLKVIGLIILIVWFLSAYKNNKDREKKAPAKDYPALILPASYMAEDSNKKPADS